MRKKLSLAPHRTICKIIKLYNVSKKAKCCNNFKLSPYSWFTLRDLIKS